MPKSDTYLAARDEFIAKTKRRRLFFDSKKASHVNARRLRRSVGGCFGNQGKFADLAVGTSRGEVTS